MMTCLALVQAAASELGIQVPSSITSIGDSQAKWKNLLYAVSRELRGTRAFPQQKRAATIALETGRTKYPLAEDFWAALPATQFDSSSRWRLIGPIPDEDWNYMLYGPGDSGSRRKFRVFGFDRAQGTNTDGGQLEIYPEPTTGEEITYEYVSATLFLPAPWTASENLNIGDERHANGNLYRATVGGVGSTSPPTHTSGSAANGAATLAYVSEPKDTILLDTDYSLWDDNVMIEGLKYKYLASIEKDYSLPYGLFNAAIGQSRARWVGSYKGKLHRGGRTARFRVRF